MRIEKLDITHLLIIQFLESRAWLFTGKIFQQMLGGMDTRIIISPEESRRYGIRKSLVKLVGQRRHEYFGRRGLLDSDREEGREKSTPSSAIAASLTVLANVGPRVGTYNANLLPRRCLMRPHSSGTVLLPLLLTPPTSAVH